MALLSVADIELLLEESGGVQISLGGVTTYGHFDEEDAVEGDDLGVVVGGPRVTVATGKFASITPGATITVDGQNWRVASPGLRVRGGAETVIPLTETA